MYGLNLRGIVEAEKVETLNLVLCGTDSSEHPLPQDLVTACNQNLNCVDAKDWWCIQDTINVDVLALESNAAKLREG